MEYIKLPPELSFYHVLQLTSTNLKMFGGNARSNSRHIICVKQILKHFFTPKLLLKTQIYLI